MKKLMILFFLSTILFTSPVFAEESNDINIYIYGDRVSFPTPPLIIHDKTFVPFRSIFEYLGSNIDWNSDTMSITARRGNIEVKLTIGSPTAFVNGKSIVLSDVPRIINGSTYVPLRFVSESFNQDVKWDGSTKTVSIGKELQPRDISDIVSPAVVYIEVHNDKNEITKSGSGFIVDKSGIVVTNFHVIDKASNIIVKLIDGRTFETNTVIGYNKDRDIAVLKIEASDLPTVSLGDSNEVGNGERIVTIGSPLGLENSISDGLISNKDRTIDSFKYIQISAAISHGSSGGALIDEKNAKVIGITTLGFVDGQNINMAIPINDFKTLNTSNKLTLDEVYQDTHVVKFSNGDYYEGDLNKGLKDGYGFYKWANGNTYLGDWIQDIYTGKGIYIWANGDKYTGDFLNGHLNGKGIMNLVSGFTYEGDFINDDRSGNGKCTWSNGNSYVGEFKQDQINGKGIYYFANGTTLIGVFQNGQYIGPR